MFFIVYSSLQKWCNLGLASLNPNYTTSVIVFLAFTYKTHFQHFLIVFIRFARLAFRAWGFAP